MSVLRASAVMALMTLASCSDEQPKPDPLADLKAKQFESAVNNLDRLQTWFSSDQGQPAPFGAEACKAAIGILMGRDAPSMQSRKTADNIFQISYRRPDGDRWTYICEATPSKIQWSTYEGNVQGPWRLADEISYAVKGSKLSLSMKGPETDGKTHSFDVRSLKRID